MRTKLYIDDKVQKIHKIICICMLRNVIKFLSIFIRSLFLCYTTQGIRLTPRRFRILTTTFPLKHVVLLKFPSKKQIVNTMSFDIPNIRSRIIIAWPGPNGSTFFLRNETQRPLTPLLPSGSWRDASGWIIYTLSVSLSLDTYGDDRRALSLWIIVRKVLHDFSPTIDAWIEHTWS